MALDKVSEVLLRLRSLHRCKRCNIFYFQKNNFSQSQVFSKGMTDKPITYSKTLASKLTTEEIFFPKPNPAVLPVEPFVIIGSLAIFLIYFCILREENKIDEILSGTYRYEGDEELKLVNAIITSRLKGLKTDDLEKKLQEIRAQR